jgi:hypothetical protein
MAEDRYVFIVEWFDSAAALVRTYNLTYYLKDKTIEMVPPPPSSSTSRINESSSNGASTALSSSRISSSELFSMSTPDS